MTKQTWCGLDAVDAVSELESMLKSVAFGDLEILEPSYVNNLLEVLGVVRAELAELDRLRALVETLSTLERTKWEARRGFMFGERPEET